MKIFTTRMTALDRTDGKIKVFEGMRIEADDWSQAEDYCRKYFPFLVIEGEWISDIPADENGNPYWNNGIDIDKVKLN